MRGIYMKKIVNLTPHALNIHNADGSIVVVSPSGAVARVAVQYQRLEETSAESGIDVYSAVLGEVVGLPDVYEANTMYVVSGMVHAAMPNCPLYRPGDPVRDEKGVIVGCKGLVG